MGGGSYVASMKLINKNMRNLTPICLLALLLALSQAQMSFDVNAASYQVVSGYWTLNVPVIGAIPPLVYNYQTLPAGWAQSQNTLQIPQAAAAVGGSWNLKVIVTDALQNKLQRTLVIKISSGAIFLGDYSYDFIFSPVLNAPPAPASNQVITQYSSSSSNSATSFGATPSTAGVISLQSSNPGANNPLPTSGQLDSLINSGDVVSIAQTVQQVIASTLTCTQKSGYLNDFLGRIQSYISIKQSQANQFDNIIENSQAQINAINSQITNFTTSISGLGIPSLQVKQAGLLTDLQRAYDAYNAANVDLTPYNLNVTSNLNSVNNLSSTLRTTNAQLAADNQSLIDTDALIASLEKQLLEAKNNRNSLQARILTETTLITNTQKRIDLLNAQNVNLNNQINSINTNKATLQANYQSLEAQTNNIKNTIAAYQAQQTQYISQIGQLKNQLQLITPNLDSTALSTVQQTISNLNAIVPSLKQQIDYVKFNCNGVVNYTVSTLNGTITYTFASSVFSTYVTNEYGQPNTNYAQSTLGSISNVTLTPITIFTPSWVDLYGASFEKDLTLFTSTNTPSKTSTSSSSSKSGSTTATSSSFSGSTSGSSNSASSNSGLLNFGTSGLSGSNSVSIGSSGSLGSSGSSGSNSVSIGSSSSSGSSPSSYFFVSDFSCSSTSTLASGAGIISEIQSNVIHVTVKGGSPAILTMGACSNILLLNQNVPKVGNNIYWRGLQLPNNAFQVYSALIF